MLLAMQLLNNIYFAEWMSEISPKLTYLPLMIWSIAVSVFLVLLGFKTMPGIAARANFYMYLASALYLSVDALDIWYRADETCVENGPQFSNSFYITVTGIAQSLTGFLGVILFQSFMGIASG